ncbi:MAG: YdcF family protein [Elusimicrobia bacterium]|nr:YdcF family protein [Elusimicrobiota bacterium]
MRSPRRPRRAPERRKLKKLWEKVRGPLAALGLATLVAVPSWVLGIGWWMDFTDEAAASDYLVVLAGDLARPHAAAEAYKAGLAPELWLSRPYKTFGQEETERLGVKIPTEEEIDVAILLKKGVPKDAIHLYGQQVLSTYYEASAFKSEAKPEGKKVLVLTSRFHARRAKMIFKHVLPGSEVRVIGAMDPNFTRRWWTVQAMAYPAILETVKTVYWLVGGRFHR